MMLFADGHPNVIRASALGLFFLTGWVEGAVFKKKSLACVTWFGGLAAFTVWIVYPLTVVRVSAGVIVFAFGLLGLISYYKEPKLFASESSNRNDKIT